MNLRRTLWSVHRWLGLLLGALFAITALTGLVLIWSDDLNLAEHPPIPAVAPGHPPGNYTAVLADWLEANPGARLQALVLPPAHAAPRAWHAFLRPTADATSSVIVALDPYRATIIDTKPSDGTWARRLVKLHYEYLAGTPGAVAGWLVATALVGLSLSGAWLYRGAWRTALRRPRPPRTRGALLQLHGWLGLWTLALALIWGVTGFIYMQSIVPGRWRARTDNAPTDPRALRLVRDLPGLHARAALHAPDGELVSVGFTPRTPIERGAAVRFRFQHRDRWFWEKISVVTLDGVTGKLISHRQPGQGTPRERLFAVVGALHFGSLGSFVQQLLWSVAGLGVFVLPLSGYALWLWRRRTAPPVAA